MDDVKLYMFRSTYGEIAFLRDIYKTEDRSETFCHIYEGTKPMVWYKAVASKKIVGCCALLLIGKEARLRGWYIMPEYRGLGLGIFMADTMVVEAKRLGVSRIEAKTRASLGKYGWTFTGKSYKSWGGKQYVVDIGG